VKLLIVARPFVFHGGIERATAGLVGALVEHGYEVHLASPPGQAAVPGVTLHKLPVPPLPASLRALVLVAAARRVMAKHAWDIVQSHERTLGQTVYRAGEGCHRGYLAARGGASVRGLYHRIVLGLERRIFARTPQIVAIARMGKREIETLYGVSPSRVSVVYNGVDLDRFHPRNRTKLRDDARTELGLPAGAFTGLFVGSGFERKGLAAALEAFAALADPAAHLIVAGKSDPARYRGHADRLGIGARVHWLGARPDLERWYAAADVCVLPSRYDPFGNVHLEALASGVPVVASTRAGGSEVVVDGRSGAVVDPTSVDAITRALEQLRLRSPARVAEMMGLARAAAEPFTYTAQVAGFAAVYRSCMRPEAQFP
jgi:UDP-glucose:(heptosyl)LPS alpha-1,3-glucosyltransferase